MRRLRIGVKEAEWALGDKNRLDAFCLLLKIKLLFRSSDLKLLSYNKCGELLHIDRTKLKRLLEYGCKIGYFKQLTNEKGDVRYVARKIHSNKEYSYKLRQDDLDKRSFPALKSLVRRVVMENHIRKQEDTFNTHDRGTLGSTTKQIRNARKRERRMLKREFCEQYNGLSYDRISKVIKGTIYQALKTTGELVRRGIISKNNRKENVKVAPEVCTNSFSYIDCSNNRIVIDARCRTAFIVQSNTYSVAHDNAIGLSNHGNKRSKTATCGKIKNNNNRG